MTRIHLTLSTLLVFTALATTACEDERAENRVIDPAPVVEDRPDLMIPAEEPALVNTVTPTLTLDEPEPPPNDEVDALDPPRVFRVGDLEVRRLAVTRAVRGREPVDAAQRFATEERPMVAFVELANYGRDDRFVQVNFITPDGQEVGLVELDVPADAPRWRTWAQSRMVTTPGRWLAEVRDEDGALIADIPFVLE